MLRHSTSTRGPGPSSSASRKKFGPLLRELRSEDLGEILIDPNFVHDWEAPSKSEDYSRHTPDAAVYARMPRAAR